MTRSLLRQYRRKFRLLLIAFLLSVSHQAGAQSAGDLAASLDAASPGDAIIVPAGSYGFVDLRNYSFSPAVTLQFEDDAVIEKMELRDVSGLTFEGLTVDAGVSLDPVRNKAVYVQRGGDLTFNNARISWAVDGDPSNDGTGFVFDTVDGVRIENSHISNVRDGIFFRSSNDIEVWGTHLTELLKDGIILSGSTNVVFRENSCSGFRRIDGQNAHSDCIQLQAGSRGVANTNVSIADNTILILDGEQAQGIFVKSRFAGAPHRQITIENNLIRHSVILGIYGENVEDLIIRGNDVLPSFDAEHAPRILVRDPSSNVLIEDNTASVIVGPAHAAMQNNTILD